MRPSPLCPARLLTCDAERASVVTPPRTMARITSPGSHVAAHGRRDVVDHHADLDVRFLLLLVVEVGQHEAHLVGLRLFLAADAALARGVAAWSSFISATRRSCPFACLSAHRHRNLRPGLTAEIDGAARGRAHFLAVGLDDDVADFHAGLRRRAVSLHAVDERAARSAEAERSASSLLTASI